MVAEKQFAKMVHDDGTEVGDVEVVEPVGPSVHKDRTERKMSFLRESGGSKMKRIARYSFPRQLKTDVDDVNKAISELDDMDALAAEDGLSELKSLRKEIEKVEKSVQFASQDKRWKMPKMVAVNMDDIEEALKEIVEDPDAVDIYKDDAESAIKDLIRELNNVEKTIGFFFRGSVDEKVASEIAKISSLLAADTFKCPECGSKVLDQTEYCVKCKKKVKKARGVIHVVDMLREEGIDVKGVGRNIIQFRNPRDIDFSISLLNESGIRYKTRGRDKLLVASERTAARSSNRFTLIVRPEDFRDKSIWSGILDDMGVASGEEANWNEPSEVELKVVGGKAY